jgi:hypothetical protein
MDQLGGMTLPDVTQLGDVRRIHRGYNRLACGLRKKLPRWNVCHVKHAGGGMKLPVAAVVTWQRPFEGYQDQPDTAERVRLEVQSIPFGLPEKVQPTGLDTSRRWPGMLVSAHSAVRRGLPGRRSASKE